MTTERQERLEDGAVRPGRKSVVHFRREDLGMRPMQGDALAQRYNDRWYLTACGIEAPSGSTTNCRVLTPFAAAFVVLCAGCEAAEASHGLGAPRERMTP